MAAFMGRTELGIEKTGSAATVPDVPKAKLMYYLNCMCSVLDLNDESNLATLRNYHRYYELSESETDQLVALCMLLSPDTLRGKVIFQDGTCCKTSLYALYSLIKQIACNEVQWLIEVVSFSCTINAIMQKRISNVKTSMVLKICK